MTLVEQLQEALGSAAEERNKLRGEVDHLREVLDSIYVEANEGTDDSHRRLVNIMEMAAKSRKDAT